MLKIFHAKHTRSLRVVWLAEELGVPFELKHMPFDPSALKADAFLDVSPFGALPAIEDGGVRIVESGAICHYLTEKYGHRPFKRVLGDADYAAYLQWMHAGEATLTPPLSAIAQHTMIRPAERRVPMMAQEAVETFHERMKVLDKWMGGSGYLLGEDFTAADVMVGYALHLASLMRLIGDTPRDIQDYWKRLSGRQAYKNAIAA
jgi:glutathione S-transferase